MDNREMILFASVFTVTALLVAGIVCVSNAESERSHTSEAELNALGDNGGTIYLIDGTDFVVIPDSKITAENGYLKIVQDDRCGHTDTSYIELYEISSISVGLL